MTERGWLHAILLVSTTAAGLPAIAESLDEGGERNTAVVTGTREKETASGTKTDTPLLQTPQAITVIGTEELIRRNDLRRGRFT
jgi:iron complex outermembrane receptor protein